MAGKRAAADVLAEWEEKMRQKAEQAQGMASGAYDQLRDGGVEPDAVPFKTAPRAQGYAQGASMGRGAQDIYDQVLSKTPGSMGSMIDTMQNGMPSGAEVGGVAQDVMAKIAQLPPQIQQQIQQLVQSGQVTMEQVAAELQKMGGAVAQQAGNVMADPAYEAKLMQNQGTMMPARPGPYPDAGGLMTDNANTINSNMKPPGMMQQPGGTGALENEAISKLQEMGIPITPEAVRQYMKMKAGAQGMFDKAKGLIQ
jgi:hypothetical protein